MIDQVMDTAKANLQLTADLDSFLGLPLRPRGALAAENLVLRKQLAFYWERNIKPRRLDAASRPAVVGLSKLFDKLFTRELSGWYTDESAWSQDWNFPMFKEWFEIEFSPVVEDLSGYESMDEACYDG